MDGVIDAEITIKPALRAVAYGLFGLIVLAPAVAVLVDSILLKLFPKWR